MKDVYEIRAVKDFLKVPASKRVAALEDFRAWLEMNDMVAEIGAGYALKTGDSFKWVDDGTLGCSEVNIKVSIDRKREAAES